MIELGQLTGASVLVWEFNLLSCFRSLDQVYKACYDTFLLGNSSTQRASVLIKSQSLLSWYQSVDSGNHCVNSGVLFFSLAFFFNKNLESHL